MRQLTVRREKTFVGSAAKAHVYIADPQGDTVISGMNCTKLGELRNNEEKTFEITEEATRVFVTADKLSQSFCKDSAAVPAGTEPVLLTGKNKFDPAGATRSVLTENLTISLCSTGAAAAKRVP